MATRKLYINIPDLLNHKLFYGKTKVTVKVTDEDIHRAVCRDHANCVGAVAIRREGDYQVTRVDFEANEVRFSYGGYRWIFHPSARAIEMLRTFDALGEKHGQVMARRLMDETEFELTFLNRKNLPSPKSRASRIERDKKYYDKAQAERRAKGLPPRVRPSRTVGTTPKAYYRSNADKSP